MQTFNCEKCGQKLTVSDQYAGKVVQCAKCRTLQRAPALPNTPDPFAYPEPTPPPRSSSAPVPPSTSLPSSNPSSSPNVPPSSSTPSAAQTSASRPPPLPPLPSIPDPPTPAPSRINRPIASGSVSARYGFHCAYCSSRLEATGAQAGTKGECPTCGNNITIPILDSYGRLIDPETNKVIKQAPHPVHAYAAAGIRAPGIIRDGDKQKIKCPKCRSLSPITSNNCAKCGAPFTLEGTEVNATSPSNSFATSSLVVGIISIFTFCTFVTPFIAVVLGIIGLVRSNQNPEIGGRGVAIAGIILGLISSALAFTMLL